MGRRVSWDLEVISSSRRGQTLHSCFYIHMFVIDFLDASVVSSC